MSALNRQVGGGHYLGMEVQPLELVYKNLGYEGLFAAVYKDVNKYMLRKKGCPVENLSKAMHELEILREHTEELE